MVQPIYIYIYIVRKAIYLQRSTPRGFDDLLPVGSMADGVEGRTIKFGASGSMSDQSVLPRLETIAAPGAKTNIHLGWGGVGGDHRCHCCRRLCCCCRVAVAMCPLPLSWPLVCCLCPLPLSWPLVCCHCPLPLCFMYVCVCVHVFVSYHIRCRSTDGMNG